MKLFVGLGNPGEKYTETRHNAGFMFVDALAKELGAKDFESSKKHKSDILKTKDFLLAKPTTFMNSSGTAVASIANFYKVKPNDIYVVHDDLDIAVGEYKIQKGKGPKVHGGLKSIEDKLGTSDFNRIRVGVANDDTRKVTKRQFIFLKKTSKIAGEDYVLMKFSSEEVKLVESVITNAIAELHDKNVI